MTIRKRLILSYIAMVLIPVILFAVIAANLASVFFGEMTGNEVSNGETQEPISPVWETFDNRGQLMAGVKLLARYDSGLLLDTNFLQEMDGAFNHIHAGFVVVKDDRVIHASPLVDRAGLYDQLKQFETDQGRGWRSKWNSRQTVERQDITFADHSEGTLFFVSDLDPFIGRMRGFIPLLFLSLLLIIGLTNGLLTYLVSRSIIKPLYTLKHAAERIKDGDLDHRLNLARKDEIGEVGEAFEEMRERLKQSIRLQMQYEENRKELISNISHDLKTPITGIKACVEGIRDGIADTEEKREKYMLMIENKATSMDHLIDELLLLSKLDLKRIPFHFEKMDITAYLLDCVQELRVDPRMRDVTIHFQNANDHPIFVSADREKLQRVIMNIVDNSLRYMKEEGKTLSVMLTSNENEVTVRIEDNGAGIDKEVLPHIFDKFYRAEPSRNSLTGGSGLGLAIVKHIVEEHGGRVSVESKIGEGTTIAFTLPIENDKNEAVNAFEKNTDH